MIIIEEKGACLGMRAGALASLDEVQPGQGWPKIAAGGRKEYWARIVLAGRVGYCGKEW
jgi:hypothetical protein